jgi:hypothetical protein
MTRDFELAISNALVVLGDRITGNAMHREMQQEARTALRALVTEHDLLLDALWKCYVATGADTDGNTRWHCSTEQAVSAAVLAVEILRSDYDECIAPEEFDALRSQNYRLARLLEESLGWMRGVEPKPAQPFLDEVATATHEVLT